MSRDLELQRARVDLYAEALRNRLARGWSPDLDALTAAIRDLPELQAQAMTLVYIQGLSVRAAARAMNRHHSTVQGFITAGTLGLGARLTP